MREDASRFQTNIDERDEGRRTAPSKGEESPFGSENLSVGVTLGARRGQPVFQFNDDRFRHTLILGRTGSGKSNLVQQMEREDIRSGAGIFVLAAHEEDALYPIACVPEERLDDVVLIDASDPDYLPCMNPLDVDACDEAAVSKMVGDVIELVNADCPYEWSGPRFETYLGAALGLLVGTPEPHRHEIAEVKELFTHPDKVKGMLAHCRDRRVYDFWTRVFPKSTRSSDSGDVVDWFLSKFSRFSSDHVLKAVFGPGRRTVDVRRVVDEGKILIAYVPEDRIGTVAARTVCKWLIMQLRDAILGRRVRGARGLDYGLYDGIGTGGLPGRELDPFFVYVDEFSKFATPDFEALLAESRKRHVGFVLSTQTLSQTRVYDRKRQREGNLEEAVLGNVGTIVAYPVGLPDAELLAGQFDVDVDVLKRIPRYRPLARLCMDNQTWRPIAVEVPLRPEPDNPTAPRRVADRMLLTGAWVDAYGRAREGGAASPTDPDAALWLGGGDAPVADRYAVPPSDPSDCSDPVPSISDIFDEELRELDELLSKYKPSDDGTDGSDSRESGSDGSDSQDLRDAGDDAEDDWGSVIGVGAHPDGLGHAYRFLRADGAYGLTDDLPEALYTAIGGVETVWAVYREGVPERLATRKEYQDELEVRIGRRISEGVSEERLKEFDSITDPDDARDWLERNRPDYYEIVEEVLAVMEMAQVIDG